MSRKKVSTDEVEGGKTKRELSIRKNTETNLQGLTRPECPDWLSPSQKRYWDIIVNHFVQSGMLAAVDVLMLTRVVVAFEALDRIDKAHSENGTLMDNNEIRQYKEYYAIASKGCAEWGMSIAARAKIGTLAWSAEKKKQEDDPLLNIIG